MKIELRAPIKMGEEVIDAIELREPTAKDIKRLGYPFAVKDMEIKTQVVFDYIVTLAALPPSTVDQIGPKDFSDLMAAIIGFFGGSED